MPNPAAEAITKTIKEKVIQIIAEQMGRDPGEITREMRLRWSVHSEGGSLEMDSLDCIEVVMQLEDEFDISIADEDAENLQTVGAASEYIAAHVAG